MGNIEKLKLIWQQLYGAKSNKQLDAFINLLHNEKINLQIEPLSDELWFKDAQIYALYVDLFNFDFDGLSSKLDYLKSLGINCLWLLPILKSPMLDAGFDVSDYKSIRSELFGQHSKNEEDYISLFESFLQKSHKHGIKIIFDIALNHTSDKHSWFQKAVNKHNKKYRDYYIWNKTDDKYSDCRIIFKGLVKSNWQQYNDEFYFHRFYEFQPDLNYQNPDVLIEISEIFIYWLKKGIDGFRVDAIPYLWKEDNTNCENLPKTHLIIKFIRGVVSYLRPNILLLAEACQPPKEVVKYFGNNDECNAGYHFPLMPQIFKSLITGDSRQITNTLNVNITPKISNENQWFLFLRLHDELTLEMVSKEDRELIYDHYCKDELMDFRQGEGISARLANLFDCNLKLITLAYNIIFTLQGSPIIYYGDEFGKINDIDFYNEMRKNTGKNDSRYLVRGRINWEWLNNKLNDNNSFNALLLAKISAMLQLRNEIGIFGKGELQWLDIDVKDNDKTNILSFKRTYKEKKIIVLSNLSGNEITVLKISGFKMNFIDKLTNMFFKELITLSPYEFVWLEPL